LKNGELTRSVLLLTATRILVNMTRRFPYPFLPGIARQLNVSLGGVQSVMAVQAGVGAASPVFGPLSERYGRRRVMLLTLAMIVAAALVGALAPQFAVFACVMIVMGVAKMIFDPTMQAYIGDRVPYQRRGLAMGTVELSWAGSLLVAGPVAGALLALSHAHVPASLLAGEISFQPVLPVTATGLQAVFALIGVLALASILVLWLFLPPDNPTGETPRLITPLDTIRLLRRSPAALGAIAYALLLATANEIFFINYGAWMEQSFELMLTALGVTTVVIGAAEIIGEVNVMTLADRFGKRRLALFGSGLAAICYIILPLLDFSLTVSLVGVFILFVGVETGIVAGFPLFTEVLPESRAVMMSSIIGAASLGRLLGAILGGVIYALTGNFVVMGLVATVIGLASWFALWRFVPEP
jgi:predicted MFS family arabinose efflux permease